MRQKEKATLEEWPEPPAEWASSYSGGRREFEGSKQKLRFAQSPSKMPISRSNSQNNLACRAGHGPFGCWALGRSGDPGVRARIWMLGGNK